MDFVTYVLTPVFHRSTEGDLALIFVIHMQRKRLIPLSQVVPHLAFEERRTRSGAGAGILREA